MELIQALRKHFYFSLIFIHGLIPADSKEIFPELMKHKTRGYTLSELVLEDIEMKSFTITQLDDKAIVTFKMEGHEFFENSKESFKENVGPWAEFNEYSISINFKRRRYYYSPNENVNVNIAVSRYGKDTRVSLKFSEKKTRSTRRLNSYF